VFELGGRPRIIGGVSVEAVQVVEEIQETLLAEDIVAASDDPEAESRLRVGLARLIEPDFEVAMIGPEYLPTTLEDRGLDGFRAVWRDWTEAFETYRIEIERMIEAGDRVVSIVKMGGQTRTGGVEIEAPGAAVWTIRDGRLTRVEFHLDVDAAMRAAGLSAEDR
jgi:uncharacterized protein